MTSRVLSRRRGRPRAAPIAAAALSLVLAACGGSERFPQTALDPRSDFATSIDRLQDLTIYLGVAVGVIVFALLAYVMLRFRYRPDSPEPEQVHGNTRLELAWTLLPAVLVAVIAVPTVRVIFETQADPGPRALTVEAIGWQWWWEFRYPMGNDTVVTANEIHVPVGQPVQVKLRGGDIVHNFWVPQMGGKRYAIPNRVNSIVFTPSEPGVYYGQCAEFCGESHALMKMRLIAHDAAGFQAWLRNEARPAVKPAATAAPTPADSAILIGKQLTTAQCGACHAIEGEQAIGRIGPNLTHLAQRGTIAAGVLPNTAENLHRWIDNPQAIKPGAKMPDLGLSEQDIGYIVAYLQTLY